MKKLLFALLLIPTLSFGQVVPISLVSLSTVTDLRTFPPQTVQMVQLLGLASLTDKNGGTYYWSSTSTTADDGFITIQVTGITTGRWLRLGNSNTIKGSATFSGALGVTSYTVAYSQGTLPFVPVGVIITPRTSAGSYGYYIPSGGITSTGFTISYNATLISLLGALTGQTITFDYIVSKQ